MKSTWGKGWKPADRADVFVTVRVVVKSDDDASVPGEANDAELPGC